MLRGDSTYESLLIHSLQLQYTTRKMVLKNFFTHKIRKDEPPLWNKSGKKETLNID